MISIIVPLYNKGRLVEKALASIAAQQYSDYEVVVVDDGSTDGSGDIVRRFALKHGMANVRIIRQANGGVAAARNRGISEAQGEFVAFLDADDEWKPNHIATLANLVARYPQCGVYATNYENLLTDGRTVPNRLRHLPFAGDVGLIDNYFVMAAESNPPLWTSAVMARREALRSVGGFPEGIKSGEDLLTWARLAVGCGIAYCAESSAVYHRGYSNPRPPEPFDEVGHQLEQLYCANRHVAGLKRYVAMWYNMRMSRCLAHRMYGKALKAMCRSLRYHPTVRIAKPFIKFTLVGMR